MAHEVFISYRHEDQEWAERICEGLGARNVTCWVASRDIPVGADWPQAITTALRESKYFVILLSSHSANEEQISREVRIAADELKLPIFPLRIEDVQPPQKINYFLGDIQWLDFFRGNVDAQLDTLANGIRGITSTTRQPSVVVNKPTAKKGINPILWLGLAAAALIAIGLIVFFSTRNHGSAAAPQAAIDTADRFLNDLNAENYQAAWNQLTPARKSQFNNREAWIKGQRNSRGTFGSFQYTLNSCPSGGNGGYSCDFTLHFGSGKTGAANVTVAQEENGQWGVAGSTVNGG